MSATMIAGVGAPFVGRVQEVTWFDRRLEETAAGNPRVVFVEGDAGIGKTRLVQEVRSLAHRRGMQICFGRSYEDLALPCLPFAEALLPHLARLSDDARRTLGSDLALILQTLGRIATAPPSDRVSPLLDADHERLQLLLAVGNVLIELARRCPTLFVIDDLHWTDRVSLDMFEHLAFTVAELAGHESVPLLIVGTHRPVAPTERLARLRERLRRDEICRTLTLNGLDEAAIGELLGALGFRRPSHQLAVSVSEATHGNPLFIKEMLHHLVREDALQRQGGYLVATTRASELRLPEQVTAALVDRARTVSEPCRAMLTLAACLGDSVDLKLLSDVGGMNENDLLALLEEATRQDLLRADGSRFRFAHPLVRQVFYHEPSIPRRQRLHRDIAERLRQRFAEDSEANLLEVAHHLVRAGTAADASVVARYARRAAEQAFAIFAWTEAASYYEAALTAAASTGTLATKERADLHYWAGLAHYYDQDVGPCLHHYDLAIENYRAAGDVVGLARALLEKTRFALATVSLGTVADIRPLEDVLTALGESEPALRGHIAAVVSEVYRNGRQAATAKQWAQAALEIGRRLENDHVSAYAGFALGLAHINDLQVRDALASWEQAVAHAGRAGDVIREGRALHRIPLALTLMGRLDDAELITARAHEATLKSHDWGNHSLGLSHQASVAVARGSFDLVERCAYDTMLMVSRSRYAWGGLRALLALASARALQGAWSEAHDALDILVEPGRVFDEPGPVIDAFAKIFRELLRAYADSNDPVNEPLAPDVMKLVGTDTYALAPLCALVELAANGRARVDTSVIVQRLTTAVDRGVLFASGWVFLLPRALGVAAAADGRWDAADAYFSEAVDVALRSGAHPELARTYLDWARSMTTRGDKALRDRAIELVATAYRMFHELRMPAFTASAVALCRALGVVPPAMRPRRADPADLSEREIDVLLHLARGRNRQEIAGDLVLGTKTISEHMRNIYDKINVRDDAAATAYAVEKGLVPPPAPPSGLEAQALLIILVTDIVASSALIHRSGDAKAHDVMQRHNALIRECLAAHDGREVTHTGDGVEAAFLAASNAVECAIAIQRALAAHNRTYPNDPIHVRIGINAGEPIATEGRLFGAAVHAAFRICARARPGTILISEVVSQLAAGKGFTLTPRGRLDLKGLGRTRAYEVTWEETQA